MSYSPGQVPANLEAIPAFLMSELQNLVQALNNPQQYAYLHTLYSPLIRPREGMVVKADGSNWNPGAGAGLYVYLNNILQNIVTSSLEKINWTPIISGSTSAGLGSYTKQVGTYIKLNKLIYITANLAWTAHSGTGNIKLDNLPFIASNSIVQPIPIFADGLTINGAPWLLIKNNTLTADVFVINNGVKNPLVMDTEVTEFNFSGCYEIQ